jgi:hypothetical protein
LGFSIDAKRLIFNSYLAHWPCGAGTRFITCLDILAVPAYVVNMGFQPNERGNKVKKEEAIRIFGSVKLLADALGVWPQAVYKWGHIVPDYRRMQIQEILKKDDVNKNE